MMRLSRNRGFSLVEVLVAVIITAALLAGLDEAMNLAFAEDAAYAERRELIRQTDFAMARMTRAISGSKRLLIPTPDNPTTPQTESTRAMLALTLDVALDRDGDGFADADNDKDGRIDEDVPPDMNNDHAHGILGVDDDDDGLVDENESGDVTNQRDDDEDGALAEDPWNGADDDGDGSADEDVGSDANGDGCPGVCGKDDDGDWSIDEGDSGDDDEDGQVDEDWFDVVRFYVEGGQLKEAIPAVNAVDGTDNVVTVLADGVTDFQVERLPDAARRNALVSLRLELTGATGKVVSFDTVVRVGSRAL